MFALLISPISHQSVIVSMKSSEFAELSVAGYTPIMQGTKRELMIYEDDLLPDENDLELNDYN